MEFELTQEIVDQIIFAMEDQTEVSFVDRITGAVITPRGEVDAREGDRYAPIPEWKPVDGYQLMERFVSGLRNPVLREELREALAAGRGVFRSFKDALRRHPEVERRWYLFKEREMRAVVYEWYNQMRELSGLERLSIEPPAETEDAEQLIAADFVFSSGVSARGEALAAADKAAFLEAEGHLGAEAVQALYRRRLAKYPSLVGPESLVIVAEDQGGQLGGFAWGAPRVVPFAAGDPWKILQLYVCPAYRGIGLGSALLRRLLLAIGDRGGTAVFVELMGSAMALGELFGREGFVPASQLLGLDVQAWAEREAEAPY